MEGGTQPPASRRQLTARWPARKRPAPGNTTANPGATAAGKSPASRRQVTGRWPARRRPGPGNATANPGGAAGATAAGGGEKNPIRGSFLNELGLSVAKCNV